ncbi:hypothetical protein [Beggiatoa leptomitoformis]|uniref:Uncharacterized protein n=1 Tax=Beggiatoa leptomitoformis TaxID=288004 RepID=A0A2N9YI22_9GAMM|nr:hypothetical protein [Beggiatoa leptomitoformis]ALG67713.1 hypothetical protein AL038_08320 [Beggiatoa leptomitoformis]AUI70049.1 hypothetical protein BLE401_15985 [Beggiatoa leptomitoformis]
MEVRFSQRPGCWERDLQRQYQNPLFAELREHEVTQTEVDLAQERDEAEQIKFANQFQSLLEEVATLQSEVEADVILRLRTKIDSLYEHCAGLGGKDYAMEKNALMKLSQLIVESINASGLQDPETLKELEKEMVARQLHFSLLEHALIAHLLHPESPIDEASIVPTLLSEDNNVLRAAMTLFGAEQQRVICAAARDLIKRLQVDGQRIPAVVWLRLETMEQPILRLH